MSDEDDSPVEDSPFDDRYGVDEGTDSEGGDRDKQPSARQQQQQTFHGKEASARFSGTGGVTRSSNEQGLESQSGKSVKHKHGQDEERRDADGNLQYYDRSVSTTGQQFARNPEPQDQDRQQGQGHQETGEKSRQSLLKRIGSGGHKLASATKSRVKSVFSSGGKK